MQDGLLTVPEGSRSFPYRPLASDLIGGAARWAIGVGTCGDDAPGM